jgi:hypothetical protein
MLISLAVKDVENYGISHRDSDLKGSLTQDRVKVADAVNAVISPWVRYAVHS